MKSTSNIGNNQGQVYQSWMASCLAKNAFGFVRIVLASRAKPSGITPKSPKGDLQSVLT